MKELPQSFRLIYGLTHLGLHLMVAHPFVSEVLITTVHKLMLLWHMSAMFGKTALVRDRVDARADRTTAYRVDIGPTDGVRILVAGHPGQGGHPRVITATTATNASFRDVIVGRVDLQQLGNATDSF